MVTIDVRFIAGDRQTGCYSCYLNHKRKLPGLQKVAAMGHKRRRALSLSAAPLFCYTADAIWLRAHDFSHVTQIQKTAQMSRCL